MTFSQKIISAFAITSFLITTFLPAAADDIQRQQRVNLAKKGFEAQERRVLALSEGQVLPQMIESQSINQFNAEFSPQQDASWKRFTDSNHGTAESRRSVAHVPMSKNLESLKGVNDVFFPQGANNPYALQPEDGGARIAQRMDALVTSVAQVTHIAHSQADVDPERFINRSMDIADLFVKDADKIYEETDAIQGEVDQMAQTLDANYQNLQQYEYITDSIAQSFNAQSDAMADRVLEMIDAVHGMKRLLDENVQNLDDMLQGFDAVGRNQSAAKDYTKSLNGQYTQARDQFMNLAMAFQDKGADPDNKAAEVVDYLSDLKVYAGQLTDYVSDGENSLAGVKAYLTQTRTYLLDSNVYLDDILNFLVENEAYFRSAKIQAEAPDSLPDVCASQGMSSDYQECSKACNTVCKYDTTIDGTNCFKCQQGGQETCWDVGQWPTTHPWCNGGICDSNPELYCETSSATGPNGTALTCIACKKRPDLCWKYYDSTTNLTNCKLGCYDGTCEYRGKYQMWEWNNRMENLHCFECVRPPDPPTCEDLKWGYDYEEDCDDNCQAPGMCIEKTRHAGGGANNPPAPNPGPDNGNQGGGAPNDAGQNGGNNAGDQKSPGQAGGDSPQKGAKKKTGVDSGGKDGGKKGPGTKPEPPKGPPQNPGGSGPSQIAGGPADQKQALGDPKPKPTTPDRPQTRVRPRPAKPAASKPTINQPEPPKPPVTPKTIWLNEWIQSNLRMIEKMAAVANNPQEGPSTRATAERIRQSYVDQNKHLNKRLQEEIDRATVERAQAEERKRRQQEYLAKRQAERKREMTFEERERQYYLKKYKQAVENLTTRATAINKHTAPRLKEFEQLKQEVEAAQKQVDDLKDEEKRVEGSLGGYSTAVTNRRKEAEKKLKRLMARFKPLSEQLKSEMAFYRRELDKLRKEVEKYHMILDPNAKQREELKRLSSYYKVLEEYKHLLKTREISDKVWEQKFEELRSKIRAKKAKGEDTDDLETRLSNMERGKKEWDAIYDRRQKTMEDEMDDMSYDNMMMGAGPVDEKHLGQKLNQYADGMDGAIKQLETLIGKINNPNDPGSKLLQQQLDNIKSMQSDLRAQATLTQGDYPMDADEIQGIVTTVYNVSEGSAKTDVPPSFMEHFVTSLGEEIYESVRNPFYMMKKQVAYGSGLVVGTAKGIYGLGELTVGAADLALETTARGLGFEDGGIFGNDASKAFQGVAQALDGNMNLDGLTKAAVMLGGAIDKELTRISRSSDVAWEAAYVPGKVVGETVLADAATAGVNKLGLFDNLVTGVDKGADALRVGDKLIDGAKQADKTLDAARAADKAFDVSDVSRQASNILDSTDDAARAGAKLDGTTRVRPRDTPTTAPRSPDIPSGKKPNIPDSAPNRVPDSPANNPSVRPDSTPQPKPKPETPAVRPDQPVRPDAKRPDRPDRPQRDMQQRDPNAGQQKVDGNADPKPVEAVKKPTREELQAAADAASDAGLKKAMDDLKSGRAADDLGEVGDDILDTGIREAPVGSLSKDLTPAQIQELFTPGANLSRQQIMQKADYLRAQRAAQRAGQPVAPNRIPDDFKGTQGFDAQDAMPTQILNNVDNTPTQMLNNYGDNLPTKRLTPGQVQDTLPTQRLSPGQVQDAISTQRLKPGSVDDAIGTQKLSPGQIQDGLPTQKLSPGQIQDNLPTQRLSPGQVQDGISTQRLSPGQIQDGISTQKLSPGQIQDNLPTQRLTPGQVQDAISTQKLKPGQVQDMLPTQRLSPNMLDDTVRMTANTADDAARRAQQTLDDLNKMDLSTPQGQLSARKAAASAARSADDAAMRAHQALDDIAKYDFPDSATKKAAEKSAQRSAKAADDAARRAHQTLDDLNRLDLSSPRAQAAAKKSAERAAQASDDAAQRALQTLDDLNKMDLDDAARRLGPDGRPLADGAAGRAHQTLDDLNNLELAPTKRYGPDGRPLADGPAGDAHRTLDNLNDMDLDKTQRLGPDGQPLIDAPPAGSGGKLDEVSAPKGNDGPGASGGPAAKPDVRGPPDDGLRPAPVISGDQRLPVVGERQARLPRGHKKRLEQVNGFRRDHSQRMHEFAQETDTYLIVRNGNPDSIKHMRNPDYMPKPMDSKAKTAIVGPHKGLVVDPTHSVQAGYFETAIEKAKKAGDLDEAARIQARWDVSKKTWKKYKDDMASKGYKPNADTGVIEFHDPSTGKVWKGLHGDYDLHGLYKRNPDGGASRVGTGAGKTLDDGTEIRRQLNEKLDGRKDYVQHGAQDDWQPAGGFKPPDPPATVFFPDGRPPVTLNNAEDMRKFYQDEMGIKWEYPDKPPVNPDDPSGIMQTMEYLNKYSFE